MGEPQLQSLEIADRIQSTNVASITLTGQNVFLNPLSGARTRYILGVLVVNASGANNFEIDKVPQSGSNVVLVKNYPVAAATVTALGGVDPPDGQKPLFILSTQENLSVILNGSQSGQSLGATFWYWDR